MASINGYELTVTKAGKVWAAKLNGKTVAACSTKSAAIANAEYLAKTMTARFFHALVTA